MKITNVRKDENSEICAVKLDNGQELDIQNAIQMASNGQIENVTVGHSKLGQQYLRSYPNGSVEDNLDRLPEF